MRVYDVELKTRLILGTAGYPSPAMLADAVHQGEPDLITVCLRREGSAGQAFRDFLAGVAAHILPNTAGCHSVKEAVTTAHMAQELFATRRIKLEVIGQDDTLQPNPFALVEAARILCNEGFEVFPYMTEDLILGEKLLEAGCRVLMPWAAPIGSGQGLRNIEALKAMRSWFKDTPLIVDAGLRTPSQAAQAMEIGFDAVLLNTAVAKARDPASMAKAFRGAIAAGRLGFTAGLMHRREMASPSTPALGLAELE